VSQAITWFLAEVGEGIILEDDCLPDLSFFPFCAEMLERYRNVSNVMQISGFNLISDSYPMESDYILSNLGWQWGWATWQRAWNQFDYKMSSWPRFKTLGLHKYFPFNSDRSKIFDDTFAGKIDTWDYQWAYAVASHSGLSVVPRLNLVRNIGFGCGTHSTTIQGTERYNIPSCSLHFPLRHFDFLFPDVRYDLMLLSTANSRTLFQKIWLILSSLRRVFKP
jgi:hypothetical protein